MNCKSRTIDGGRSDMLMSSHGQWHHDMGFSVNEHQDSNHWMPVMLPDLERNSRNVPSDIPDQYLCYQRAHDLPNLHVPIEGEHFNVHELALYEQMLCRRRELIKKKVTQRMRQLQSVEDDRTFIKQMIAKQHQMSQFLRKDYEMESRFPSRRGTIKWDHDVHNVGNEAEKLLWSCPSMEMENFSGSSQKTMEQSESISPQPQDPQQKTRHCRHFLKGHCARGDACGFRHDRSVFCTDLQKVFLGGLPPHMTSSLLQEKLAEQGYTVLNQPKILHWFSPQVCLGSVEEARKLIEKGSILIDGVFIRVRPYEGYSRDNKKIPSDVVERSVFLGGLAPLTTVDMIKDVIGKMGMKVVNIPVLKSGYSPQVTLESVGQTQTLLNLMRVQINGVMVSVRPFANIRNSFRRRKKKDGQKLRTLE